MKFEYSVLMPVYHGDDPDHLITAIDSMLNQTLKPEEFFIAVDGPVSDDILWILEGYRAEHEGLFTLKYYPESRGIALTLRDALPLCRNEFVARMDADDYSAPERIEKQAAVFEAHPAYSVVGCNVDEFVDDITKPVSHVRLPETTEEILKFARRRIPMRHPAMFYKKSEVISAGNYRNVYKYEDYDILVRMLRKMTMGGGHTTFRKSSCI